MKKLSSLLFISAFCVMLVSLIGCSGGNSKGGNFPKSSSSKQMTAFGFTIPASTGIINETAKTIAIKVPYKTDVTKLVAVFTTTGVKTTVGGVEQASGTTENKFTDSVLYSVIAEDGSKAEYTVTVTVAQSDEKDITGFTIDKQLSSTISGKDITVVMPYGTDKKSLTPAITHTGASISPTSADSQNFTGSVNYTVTAADGSKKDYTVTVQILLSSEKEITKFTILGIDAIINGTDITLTVPYGSDVKTLVPTIIYKGKSISPESDIVHDFTSSVKYTVTAEDDSPNEYTVTVTVGHQSWAKNFGGTAGDIGNSVCLDSDGNVYVAGMFSGTANLGDVTLSSAGGSTDSFLIKYSPDGTCLWAKAIGSSNVDWGKAVCVDSKNNVYVTGYFAGSVDFGKGYVSSTGGSTDAFLVKYASDGTCLWSNTIGDIGEENGNAVCVDSSNNVYITGYFTNQINFGSGAVTCNGKADIFIAKYLPDGALVWSKTIGGSDATHSDIGTSLCAGPLNILYVSGIFCGSADFGGGTVTGSDKAYSFFIVKYLSDGTFQWIKTSGTNSSAYASSVCTDAEGSVYATGDYLGRIDFGNGNIIRRMDSHAYIVKYASNGTFQWVNVFDGVDSGSTGFDLCIGQSGNIYLTGNFLGTVNIGGNNEIISENSWDIFIIKYSPDGEYQQGRTIGGNDGGDWGYSICSDMSDNVYITGSFQQTIDFGFGNITSNGADDFFIIKN